MDNQTLSISSSGLGMRHLARGRTRCLRHRSLSLSKRGTEPNIYVSGTGNVESSLFVFGWFVICMFVLFGVFF